MTKTAAVFIYGKIFENLLLRNRTANDLETWYAALVAPALSSLFKWWPLVDLDLFYGTVKCSYLGFCMWKRWNSGFFWFCCSLWHQSWFMRSAKWNVINTKIQGHLLTFVLDAPDSVFLTSSPLKLLGWLKLHVESFWMGEFAWDLDHKMSAMPIYDKNALKVFFSGLKGRWPRN